MNDLLRVGVPTLQEKEYIMFLYVILGIAAVIIIALTVVLWRRGAQMEGSDHARGQKGMAKALRFPRNGGQF